MNDYQVKSRIGKVEKADEVTGKAIDNKRGRPIPDISQPAFAED